MQIDIVSDVICPWCFIGKRRLERALALRPELAATLSWRAFQLNPEMPSDGISRELYLSAKYGGSRGDICPTRPASRLRSHDRLTAGLTFTADNAANPASILAPFRRHDPKELC